MRASTPVTIVNVGYRSTNVWVISRGRSRLMLDLGYPAMLGQMWANQKCVDVSVRLRRWPRANLNPIGRGRRIQHWSAPV